MRRIQAHLRNHLLAARRRWRMRVFARGSLLGLATAAGSVLVLGLVAWLFGLPGGPLDPLNGWLPAARWIPFAGLLVPVVAGAAAAVFRAPDLPAFALRLGELDPDAGHLPSLLLELDPSHPYAPDLFRAVEAPLREHHPGRLVGPWLRPREGLAAGIATAGALAVLLVAGGPQAVWERWGAVPRNPAVAAETPMDDPVEMAARDVLSEIDVRVLPPAYTGLPATTADPAEGIVALAGSRVELEGPLPPAASGVHPPTVRLLAGDGRREIKAATRTGGRAARWNTGWMVAEGDRGVLLSMARDADGGGAAAGAAGPETGGEGLAERVVPIEVLPDEPPSVELLEPGGDMVLATGTGEVRFRARAVDRFGVQDFALTWVHTRGSGESFDFREGRRGWAEVRDVEGGLEGTLTLPLADLDLGPGDVVHLRAVALDGNDATGPGEGASETRQIRIVREGEEMNVDALVGFPLEAEREPVLSQRMILLLTRELVERAPELTEAEFRDEAGHIAEEQARLRAEVAEQVFSRATGAMEPSDAHLGEDAHDANALAEVPDPLRAGGSRYGVATIFDPAAQERQAQEREAQEGASEALRRGMGPGGTGPDEAGTNVGDYLLGDATRMPVGFGVLEDLGHQHDGDPILSVNQPLLSVHDHMWESERFLRTYDPDGSVPSQEAAIEELQVLRENARVYARGTVTAPPVDVAEARGTGEVDEADPAPRSPGEARAAAARWVAGIEDLLESASGASAVGVESGDGNLAGDEVRLTRLAAGMLADPAVPTEAGTLVARAADRARNGEPAGPLLRETISVLDPAPGRAGRTESVAVPAGPVSAALRDAFTLAGESALADLPPGDDAEAPRVPSGAGARPFVFATLRYESGNWDSAPLVPQNLIHALAQYTDLHVAPEGTVVDLSSREIFRYPVLYLTGHLPVRFTEPEARNLREYVERGGFVFMDDHNHDLDGAFHRTATAELARLFGDDALAPLPNDHELYSAFFRFEEGPPATGHELSGWGDGLIHPELQAVEVDGRIGVLYSNKDYSSEWSYHAVNKRFLALDNTRFGVNILIYALTR